MMLKWRRGLALLLTVVMAFSLLQLPAFAADTGADADEAGGTSAVSDAVESAEQEQSEESAETPVPEEAEPESADEDAAVPDTQDAEVIASGTCGAQGDNATWELTESGTLTFRGTGEMSDTYYSDHGASNLPWWDYRLQIKRVVVENGITSVGDSAFENCTNLETVELAESVERIGDSAFERCRLTELTLPESLRKLGDNAFAYCTKLKEVVLPGSLTYIGAWAFSSCTSLSKVEAADVAAELLFDGGVFKGCTALADEHGFVVVKGVLYDYLGDEAEPTLPEVSYISNSAFYDNDAITHIVIPDSVQDIGAWAFAKCENLSQVTIPDSVTWIGNDAFHGCSNLERPEIAEHTEIQYGAFQGCLKMAGQDGYIVVNRTLFDYVGTATELTLPDVTSIEPNIFTNHDELTSVILPEHLESIYTWAFYGCTGLTSITIPASVTWLGIDAFKNCTGLQDIWFEGDAVREGYDDGETVFDGVTANAHCYDQYTDSWMSVLNELGGELTWSNQAGYFGTCGGQGDNVTWVLDEEGTLMISGTGRMMDYNHDGLKFSCAPWKNFVTQIERVVIEEGVTHINYGAFSFCANLKQVVIPSSVTNISFDAFDNCTSLEELEIPEGVQTIELYAFSNCASLKKLILPASLKQLDGAAFALCSALQEIRFRGAAPDVPGVQVDGTAFPDAVAVVRYPKTYADSWTDGVKGLMGENLTWEMYDDTPNPEPIENPFVDVSESDYYYDAVLWAYSNNITSGKDATHFQPDAACTRAQVVTFLWRANGQPEPTSTTNPFVDVSKDSYYYKAVLWAAEKGITSGKDATHFQPDATVTRAQFVTFLWRSEGKPAPKGDNPFVDVANGQYYTDAVVWAYENGITSGKDATHFQPDANCIRAQVVTFLYRNMQ